MSAPDPGNIRWRDVRERIKRDYEATRDALVSAPPERVPVLQGKAQALAEIIDWFERGAIADKSLTDSFPTPTAQGY